MYRLPDPPPEFLTANQVADLLCVQPATVRRWARIGKLPCVRLGKRAIRFRFRSIRWLAGLGSDGEMAGPVRGARAHTR